MKTIIYKCKMCGRWRINPLWRIESGGYLCQHCALEGTRKIVNKALTLMQDSTQEIQTFINTQLKLHNEIVEMLLKMLKEKEGANGNEKEVK